MPATTTRKGKAMAPADRQRQCPLQALKLIDLRAPEEFSATVGALRRRAGILGIDVAEPIVDPSAIDLHARLTDDAGHVVELHVLGWPSGIHAVSDVLIQAASGITAWHRRATGAFLPLGIDFVATLGASLATMAAVAAMVGQRRAIESHRVELSLGGSALLCMAQYLAMDCASPSTREGAARHQGRKPPFTSRDAVLFELEALDPLAWERFWREIGTPAEAIAAGWPVFMSRYTQARAPLPTALFDAVVRHDYVTLRNVARQSGADVCRLRQAEELFSDARAGAWVEGGPWRFEMADGTSRAEPEHLPAAAGRPLTGFTVLEACRLIQGPLAGHLLRELGARVIKIEPPGGDPMRGMPPLAGDISAHFDAINRGKESVELDLRSSAGRTALLALAQDADVFLHNWAPGRAERLDLTPEVFRRCAPNLVYASASGTGRTPHPDDPIATDFMMQAFGGIASRIRQPSGQGGALLTLIDVLGGIAVAEGIVAALYARLDGKHRVQLDSAMAGAAALLMAQELQRAGPAALAPKSLNARLGLPAAFRARDGYLMMERLTSPEAERYLAALCGTDSEQGRGHDAAQALAALLCRHGALHWCLDFNAHGIAAAPIALNVDAINAQPWMKGVLARSTDCFQTPRPWTITS